MQLQNIHNTGRTVYLFNRDNNGNQSIEVDDSYYPYYYQEHPQGEYLSYTGKKLKRFVVPHPKNVREMRESSNWGTDVTYTKMYILDKVPEITPGLVNYVLVDIEILCTEFPHWEECKYPISCITLYSNLNDQSYTWFLGDWNKDEELMFQDFIGVLKGLNVDCICAWNGDSFDWPYLYSRIKKILKLDFAKEISPINQNRYGRIKNIWYPAGISILDYMEMFKKYTLIKNRHII